MQSKPHGARRPAKTRIPRGVKMEAELWEFVEWRAAENGLRSASSQIRELVLRERAAFDKEAA